MKCRILNDCGRMPLKDDLLRKGYFPENLPPSFGTAAIADYFLANPHQGYLSQRERALRPAQYNASKRGLTRRVFAAVHPETAHDMAEFVASRWGDINAFFDGNAISFSVPHTDDDSDRALVIHSHLLLEEEKLKRLSSYRFIAATDVARFYHSIYTHSIPWAFHGKAASKADRRIQSATVYFNRADFVVRNGQDGQTVGIPVGPDMSRVFAEVIATAIDRVFQERLDDIDCVALRHVDDVWIGANTHADAERVLSRYREAIREFELDINESKTRIYSEDFTFSDFWPSELAQQLEFAIRTHGRKGHERLRSAFEHSFALTARDHDDGILKYMLRGIDLYGLALTNWQVVEPFLKRAAVHFGHTVDYVARILVWRHLRNHDLDVAAWTPILHSILEKHARLGNDSEVCWTIYALQMLEAPIRDEDAMRVVQNCGALSMVAVLNCVELGLVSEGIFATARARLEGENACGRYWPVYLEWLARPWPGHDQLAAENDIIASLADQQVTIYDPDAVPLVFRDVDEEEFNQVGRAIERRSSMYEDEDEDIFGPNTIDPDALF